MIYFGIVFFLLLLGVINKQSKFVLLLLYIALMFVSTHFTEGFDLKNYESAYNHLFFATDVDESERSLAWDMLMFYSNMFGLSFGQFRLLCFFLWSIPIFFFVYKTTDIPAWVIAITFIFPIITFSSQMRNGVAVSFLYWALYFYFKRKDGKGLFIYTLLVTLAGFFHYVAFVYLLGIFTFNKKIKTKVLLRCVAIIVPMVILFVESGSLSFFVSSWFGNYYYEYYLSEYEGFFYWKNLLLSIGILINYWFSYISMRKYKEREDNLKPLKNDLPLYVFRFNTIMLLALPVLAISNHFYRIFQNIFILTAISVAITSVIYKRSNFGVSQRIMYMLFYIIGITAVFGIIDSGFFIFWNSISL